MEPIITAEDRQKIRKLRVTNFLHGAAGATLSFNVLFLQTRGMEPGTVGVVMGLNAIIGALAPPMWGLIADRIQSRYRIFVYTALGACALSVLIPVSATVKIFGVMLATFCIPMMNFFRMPNQAMMDAASVSASSMVPGLEYSNVRCFMSIGYTVMCFVYSPLVSLFGVDFPFYSFLFFTVLLYLSRKTLKQYDAHGTVERHSEKTGGMQLSRLFRNYYLMVFLIINLLIQIPQQSSMMLAYLLAAVKANTALVGTVSGVRVLAEILVLFLSHHIKRVLSQPMMMVTAAVLSLCEMLSYQFVNGPVSVALCAMFGGASFGFILSTGFNYVNNLAPDGLKATAIALYSIGSPAAGVLVSFVGGRVIAAQGVRMLYLYCAICAVLWLIVFFASYAIGEKMLKRKAPLPLFKRETLL